LNRKEEYAGSGYFGRAAQNSVAGAATTSAQGTAARQRLHSRHAASPAASPAASLVAAAVSLACLAQGYR